MRSHMFQVTICIGDHTCILGGDGGNVSIIYGTSQQQSSYRYIRDRGKQFSLLLVNPCFIFENLELNKIKSINIMKIPIWNVLWNTIPLFTMPEYILYICILAS